MFFLCGILTVHSYVILQVFLFSLKIKDYVAVVCYIVFHHAIYGGKKKLMVGWTQKPLPIKFEIIGSVSLLHVYYEGECIQDQATELQRTAWKDTWFGNELLGTESAFWKVQEQTQRKMVNVFHVVNCQC